MEEGADRDNVARLRSRRQGTTDTAAERVTALDIIPNTQAFHLREQLEAMEATGALPPQLKALKDELARLRLVDATKRAPAEATEEGGA